MEKENMESSGNTEKFVLDRNKILRTTQKIHKQIVAAEE